jgi:hypothetical protein
MTVVVWQCGSGSGWQWLWMLWMLDAVDAELVLLIRLASQIDVACGSG